MVEIHTDENHRQAITDDIIQIHNVMCTVFPFGLIGVITFVMSAIGVKVGNIFGARYKSRAELAGGIILVILGIRILLEHLGIL